MIDLTEIKKLPDEEKWKIIEEIEESIADMGQPSEPTDTEYEEKLNQLLTERLAAYESGILKSFTWQEVKDRLNSVREKAHSSYNG